MCGYAKYDISEEGFCNSRGAISFDYAVFQLRYCPKNYISWF